ncbi:3-oxoacyl-ACP reductase family protein [Hansschlegelia sp. KR7-227]|uniref:3-oxoacyl-ACP reductase family protein n=1 Tax=Hansschlegelia sp. KR7-227 TaxID=3400914 RepID=UPI003C00C61E
MSGTDASLPLLGKRALVTGASRGIGAAIALRLARDGADVAITYSASPDKAEAVAEQIRGLGRVGVAIRADAADAAQVKASVEETVERLGGLDILVNNAGIARGGHISEMTLEDIDATLAVNVRAVVIASQAAATHLPDGGRIISIGSCLAERVTFDGISVYAMSKSALIGFTKGLARDLGPRSINVNIVHPGPVDTDMNPSDGPQAPSMLAGMAIKKYGAPEDIAGAVAWLAGPEGRYVTGAGFTLDGGVNA